VAPAGVAAAGAAAATGAAATGAAAATRAAAPALRAAAAAATARAARSIDRTHGVCLRSLENDFESLYLDWRDEPLYNYSGEPLHN
jgi:hypothetical protein